jgi:hypothetical protein
MLYDGCHGVEDYDDCSRVVNGLFGRGLHATIQYYVATARDLQSSMTALNYSLVPPSVRKLGDDCCVLAFPRC